MVGESPADAREETEGNQGGEDGQMRAHHDKYVDEIQNIEGEGENRSDAGAEMESERECGEAKTFEESAEVQTGV